MGGVGRDALGGEWVLDVGEAELRGVGLVDGQVDGLPVGSASSIVWASRVDVADQRGGAVAQRSVIGVVDGATDLDLVAGVEGVRAAGRRDRCRVPSSPCWWRIAW